MTSADDSVGAMTSAALTQMLAEGVWAEHPHVEVVGRSKVEILEGVRRRAGWPAVFELGRRVRGLGGHPVVRALVALPDPPTILARWRLLERFGHTRNRTRERERSARPEVVLDHVATDGEAIPMVDDLFIWGLLIGLVELAGVRGVEASFAPGGEAPFYPVPPDASENDRPTGGTHVIALHWREGPGEEPVRDALPTERPTAERLRDLVGRDLLQTWSARGAARAIGHSLRGMQRALRREGMTFSEAVQRERVSQAERLLADRTLSLAEVAFVTGFADQAHFTRTFRKYVDVPPSALRAVVESSRNDPER